MAGFLAAVAVDRADEMRERRAKGPTLCSGWQGMSPQMRAQWWTADGEDLQAHHWWGEDAKGWGTHQP